MNMKGIVFAVAGVLGGIAVKLFGGWSSDMITLLIFMAIDFVTGLLVAGVFKNSTKTEGGSLDSRVGWKGLCKKCVTLLFVIIAHRLDIALGADYVRTAVIIGFILNELLSIIENAGLMGIKLPEVIIKALDVLEGKVNFDDGDGEG